VVYSNCDLWQLPFVQGPPAIEYTTGGLIIQPGETV
jgi:hypothetical protein